MNWRQTCTWNYSLQTCCSTLLWFDSYTVWRFYHHHRCRWQTLKFLPLLCLPVNMHLEPKVQRAFISVHFWVGWLGIVASNFCNAFRGVMLHVGVKAPEWRPIGQIRGLMSSNGLKPSLSLTVRQKNFFQWLSGSSFAHAVCHCERGQLAYIPGLHSGDI